MVDFLSSDPPNELFVVGEHAENPSYLLLRGIDGQYYAYEPSDGPPHPVDIDDAWRIEAPPDNDLMP